MENNYLQKEFEYKQYLTTHAQFVERAWKSIKDHNESFIEEFSKFHNGHPEGYLAIIDENIKIHDDSCFEISEFKECRAYLFPIDNEEKNNIDVKNNYEKAMNYHYSHNPHHWQFYVKDDTVLDMTSVYIIEMICDMIADIAIKKNISTVYSLNTDDLKISYDKLINDPKVKLSENTKELLERFINAIVSVPEISLV